MRAGPTDGWDAGETYEAFMGRWSRPLAEEFVQWLGPPPAWDWLDVGTGTGALASALLAVAHARSVVGCDPSRAFVDFAESMVADTRARFEVADAEHLPPRDGGYDAVVSGLALNFFPDPQRALERQVSVVRPGGWVAAVVWDYAGGMEFLRAFWDAAAEIDPRAAEIDEARRFPLCEPVALRTLFSDAGLRAVRTGSIRVRTRFADFDDCWRPLLGGVGPAPSFVASLPEGQRAKLEAALRRTLQEGRGGPIDLPARAWAVAGERP
ncbi:MAG: class I SAM-dependent methyltransferase [Gemmatimonadales bacterium]